MPEMSLNLPMDLCLLETQVAGHTFDCLSYKYGMLRDKSGSSVFKPLLKPECAEREISFYKKLKKETNDSDAELQVFIPRYEGHMQMSIHGNEQLFIKMENLAHSMALPCVMDIKIGKRTWDPFATSEKITMEEQKYAACKNNIGLCIPGYQMYSSSGEKLKFGKEYGKALNPKTFCDTLVMFLSAQNICYKPLIKAIIRKLYRLQKWFTYQTSMNFFSSSILISYDYEKLLKKIEEIKNGDVVTSNGFQSPKMRDCVDWVQVKMIDFAHVFDTEKETCDANYLFGLQNLIYILQNILIEMW